MKLFMYLLSLAMIVVGLVLVGGGARLAGGDMGAPAPVKGFVVSVVGVAFFLVSYAPVKRLRLELAYRTSIYIALVWSCVPLAAAVSTIVRFGIPRVKSDADFILFQVALGIVAIVNLFILCRWTGNANTPPRAPIS